MAVAKIGSSRKRNHHNQIRLAQIPDMERFTDFWIFDKGLSLCLSIPNSTSTFLFSVT